MIAQVPFLDPYSSIAHVGMAHLLWATPHGILDVVKARLGLEPHYVKLVDRPGRFAAMNTPESLPGMLSIVPNEADWQNRVCARILFKFPMYRPLRFASRVKCPALLMLAEAVILGKHSQRGQTHDQCAGHRLPIRAFRHLSWRSFQRCNCKADRVSNATPSKLIASRGAASGGASA
jgi:hypothetical protein